MLITGGDKTRSGVEQALVILWDFPKKYKSHPFFSQKRRYG
jgi:hypothetical protein